jgi:hypothetical protein
MRNDIAERLDKLALGVMNRRIPATLETTYQDALTFAEVLAQTRVNVGRTAVSQLLSPGIHPIWLDTPLGELVCRVRVCLAADPHAPLLLYHHGLNEYPFDSSWRRLFALSAVPPMHHVVIQAPYHENWMNPLLVGFSSLQHIYQMFAGSLRMMELVQTAFEAEGAPYTIVAGVSWGGITSLLYEGIFHQSRAVIPMLASPNVAQAMWDIADLLARPLTISKDSLFAHLDFTPIYQQIDNDHIYPLLGEQDQFFRLNNHAGVFGGRPLVTTPGSHITNLWRIKPLRDHLLKIVNSKQ